MRVPGKKEADDTAILARADEMFPHDRGLFRGPKGGKLIDRAEAGMIGLFGCHHILRTMSAITNLEARMVYRIADTGA